jgi:hypothetical protein
MVITLRHCHFTLYCDGADKVCSGIMVATIIEIGRHVGPFFLMLLLVVIGFSHAMVVVLHQPFDLTSALDIKYLSNRTGAADFNTVFSSFKYTFYLLTSDGDAYNEWDGVPSTDALRIIFLIFTAIIVLNVLIALMSNIVSKVDSEGRQRWLKVKRNISGNEQMVFAKHLFAGLGAQYCRDRIVLDDIS